MFGEEFGRYKDRLFRDAEFRNQQAECPLCGQNIQDRTISLWKGLIEALHRVYCWCGEKRIHEFHMKDIRHLLGRNEYARFGDLVRFGGLVYKPDGKSSYGINMARAKEFFAGQRQIPLQITINQLTNEILDSHYISVGDFPELVELLTKEGLYDPHKKFNQNQNEKENFVPSVSTVAPSGSAVPARPQNKGTLW